MSLSPFDHAMALVDAANAEDPRQERGSAGELAPRELLYGQRMSDMLRRFAPAADGAMQVAVRAQHIQRWQTPRDSYPPTREGYLQWRSGLYRFHAETVSRLMTVAGCDEASIARVAQAVGKRGLKVNPDTQLLEDVTDLVFLEHYLQAFADNHPEYTEEKWLAIIRKTWQKMSAPARVFALSGQVRLPASLVPLITRAVADEPPPPATV